MIPLAKFFGLRVVASLHGIDSQRDKWGGFASKYLEFGERMAATKADVCLVLSKNMKQYIDTKYGVDSVLFANGIDKPEKHDADIIKDKYGLEKDSYILSLGRIVPEKGLQYLIEAFKNCKTDKKLVIAGGSESNRDYYNQLLELADGDKRIVFTGYVYGQEVQELYSNSYIFAYTMMVDKYEVKKYVASKIGEEHIIKTLGVWDHFDDIDFAQLPNQFVLKCTHDSGGLVICTDKSKLDLAAAKKKIEKSLKNDYYMQNREWPYKNVKRRIIAEEYMVDESGYELKDYKIFAFDGEAKAMFIASDRTNPNEETKFDFFDMDFNHLPFTNGHPNSKEWDKIKRPKGLDEMKKYAEILSKGLPEARIDFYDINGKVYFGEITFFHWSGFERFEPAEWDKKFGSWITLPTK